MGNAVLTYYIFEGRLVGIVNKKLFDLHALSGGGGGTRGGNDNPRVVNNPYMTALKTSGKRMHVHGGPIPTGSYMVGKPFKHPHLGLAALLQFRSSNTMFGRSGFFIHGRGAHGSDGCIVPMEQFQDFMEALSADDGGYLTVLETSLFGRFA